MYPPSSIAVLKLKGIRNNSCEIQEILSYIFSSFSSIMIGQPQASGPFSGGKHRKTSPARPSTHVTLLSLPLGITPPAPQVSLIQTFKPQIDEDGCALAWPSRCARLSFPAHSSSPTPSLNVLHSEFPPKKMPTANCRRSPSPSLCSS